MKAVCTCRRSHGRQVPPMEEEMRGASVTTRITPSEFGLEIFQEMEFLNSPALTLQRHYCSIYSIRSLIILRMNGLRCRRDWTSVTCALNPDWCLMIFARAR